MKTFKSLVLSVLPWVCSAPLFALDYTNSQLAFSATLPDGLEDFSSQTRVKTLISLGKADSSPNGRIEMINILDMGGAIGREDMSQRADAQRNLTLEKAAWKEFQIDVFRVAEDIQGVSFVTFNAQVPLKPHAIQITVSGPESDEGRLRADMQRIVASVEGQTNWVRYGGVGGPLQYNLVAVVIGLVALIGGKLRVTRHYGLQGAGARAAGIAIVLIGVALPKLMPPLARFARLQGVDSVTLLLGWLALNCAVIWVVVMLLVNHHGNAYAKDPDEAIVPPPPPRSPGAIRRCRMCQRTIPSEEVTKSCPDCGADLTTWRTC